MRLLKILFFPLLFLVLITACNAKENKNERKQQKIEAAKKLSIFNEARRQAKSTFPTFIRKFDNKKKSRAYNYSVRMAFNTFDGEEYVWLNSLRYENGTLFGIVSNEPKRLDGIKKGDKIKIEDSNLVDWMYFYKDKLYGGYTIKAARNEMTAAERAKFDKSFPVKIVD